MMPEKKERIITPKITKSFSVYLREQEKTAATIESYQRSLTSLCNFIGNEPVTKSALISWKEALTQQYAPSSVNTMLAGINTFLSFMGWFDYKLKPLKIQRNLF
ncbi:MAG: site-specific integrase, partial [Clostridiales bacterium]|nr:site-specific integrase [Clostridiales bacterium]